MTERNASRTCPTEKLLLYHYRELTERDRLEVEQHLLTCSACRTESAELDALLGAMSKKSFELSPGEIQKFSDRVMENLPQKRRRISSPALGWGLAGVAILLVSLNLLRQTPTQLPFPPVPPQNLSAEPGSLPNLDLLRNLDLLENYELVLQLDRLG